jgi:hypothetical protein
MPVRVLFVFHLADTCLAMDSGAKAPRVIEKQRKKFFFREEPRARYFPEEIYFHPPAVAVEAGRASQLFRFERFISRFNAKDK